MDHASAGGVTVTLLHFTLTAHQRRPLTRVGIYRIVYRPIATIELNEVSRLRREALPKAKSTESQFMHVLVGGMPTNADVSTDG